MKITYSIDGGFAFTPGLSRPVTVDTAKVDPATALELEGLVRDSAFFGLPARPAEAAPGAADLQTHTITVEDGSRVHAVQLIDPLPDGPLAQMVSRLAAIGRSSPR